MEKMVVITQEDEYAMHAFGISREDFIATRQKELARRKRFEPTASRAKAPGSDPDPDGLSEGDLYAMVTVGISRDDFLAARKKERERRP